MRLDAFVLADAVSTPPDGKFYVLGGGLSRVEIPMLPFPFQISALIRLLADEDDELEKSHRYRLTLIGPTGQPNVQPIEFESPPEEAPTLLLDGEQRYIHIGATIQAAAVRTGLYHLQLRVDGEVVGDIPFPVAIAEEAARVQAPEPVKAASRPATKRPPPPPKKAKRQRR